MTWDTNKMTKNETITLEKIKIEDIERLKEWDSYKDPLFAGYNYNSLSQREGEIWYVTKLKRFNALYFSINLDDRMIGFVGIKEINKLLKRAKLGIVFDPKYTSMGYGKIAMEMFLDYFFNDLKMRTMTLEVNSWNQRAISLYESLGFQVYRQEYQEFENQKLDIKDPQYEDMTDDFKIENERLLTRVYFMKLRKEEYLYEI